MKSKVAEDFLSGKESIKDIQMVHKFCILLLRLNSYRMFRRQEKELDILVKSNETLVNRLERIRIQREEQYNLYLSNVKVLSKEFSMKEKNVLNVISVLDRANFESVVHLTTGCTDMMLFKGNGWTRDDLMNSYDGKPNFDHWYEKIKKKIKSFIR